MRVPLPERTTICGLRALADPAGHSHVLSIIDPETPYPEAFSGWSPDDHLILRFDDDIDPYPGRVAPDRKHVEAILAFWRGVQDDGERRLFIHCMAGISRSTAAALTIWADAAPDGAEADVVADLARLRPRAWPNSRMVDLADDVLGRGGRLSAAVRAFFRARLAAEPELAETLAQLSRLSDVAVA